MEHREVCQRCRRPSSVCFCPHLASIPTRSRVVFLQHPRERYVPIGTARMAHLSLPNSELHLGIDFSSHQRVQALAARAGTAVLFPGEGAADPRTLVDCPPEHLIVVDGTWPQAKKVLERNPALRALPRVGLSPRRPGNYRIRKEPSAECLSTIEAVAEVLGQLEGAHERFDELLRAFDFMIDRQLSCQAERTGPPRYKLKRLRQPRSPLLPRPLMEERARVVLVYGEANAHPRELSLQRPGELSPELVHLVLSRVESGERLDLLLRPRRPLAPSTPYHLQLSAADFEGGLSVEEGKRGLERFLREGDALCGWGYFTFELMREVGYAPGGYFDLRQPAMRVLEERPKGLDEAAVALGAQVLPGAALRGRAGERMAALEVVMRRLWAKARFWSLPAALRAEAEAREARSA